MISGDLAVKTAIALLGGALGAAFGAGGAVWQMRSQGRDLNGLGRKFGRFTALLVRWADTEEKRGQVADLIEGKKNGSD